VRKLIDEDKSFDEIHIIYPMITEDDLAQFKAKEGLRSTKALREWGKEMRGKNIGNHNLGSRGYPGKQPIWDKEDAALRADGKENPYDWFPDPLA
jgi:hypothetical protein